MLTTLDRLKSFTNQQTHNQPPPPLTDNPETKGQGLRKYKSNSEGVARFQQTKVLKALSSKKIASRGITVQNVISREGIKAILGKVSTMSTLKDGARRLLYRMRNSNQTASSEVGGTHRSLIRLTGEYHTLSQNPTPGNLERRNELLQKIDSRLSNLQEKTEVLNGGRERTKAVDLKLLKAFVRYETNLIRPKDLPPMQPPPDIPDAPIRPNPSEAKPYTVPVKTKGHFLDEVRQKLEVVEQPPKEEIPLGEMPNAPLLPNPPELRPYTGNLGSKGSTLNEVIENLNQTAGMTHEVNSLDWAKMEFDNVSSGDLDNHDVRQDVPEPQPRKTFADMSLKDVPGFSLKSQEYNKIEDQICEAMMVNGGNDENAQVEAGKLLGQLIGRQLGQHMANMTAGEKRDFLTSFYTSDRNSIMGPVMKEIGLRFPRFSQYFRHFDTSMDQCKTVLTAAYAEMHQFLPDRCSESGEEITLNGVNYRLVSGLDEGGHGAVSIYQEVTDLPNPERIVVKRSLYEHSGNASTRLKGFQQQVKESRMHASLGDNNSVTAFRGVVQTPGGGILLAMNLAPHGDVGGMMSKLNDAEKSGLISHEAANAVRITLLKDMVEGLKQLQENLGTIHLDLKMQNFFIEGDGKARMGDFGLMENGLSTSVTNLKIDAEYNKAPELMKGQEVQSMRSNAILDMKNNYAENEQSKLNAQSRKEDAEYSIQIDTKADVFALGTAAYEMFTGRKFIEDLTGDGWDKAFDALNDFGQNPTRTVTTLGMERMPEEIDVLNTVTNKMEKVNDPNDSPRRVGLGVTVMDRVLNAMLHPDKDQRPSMRDLLNFSVFNQPGIETNHVRNLIKLLGTPGTSPEQLKVASRNVGF
ncbi:protein kinase domain-containing protein [Prosthecobacter vanneervenii]|uniref:Serine/threonine protein kinase n=1 Tax=Prosthecobacter vanneervenii TaxID=48466 RepID=A0A7W7Y7V1_9BACT|nr:protein kinase [Prosthecobacter vanneervenii]MBB5031252.1 serine/threonine protein kinase [Prosthecobacter vanneervenii]